jgi:hypothetical protein
MSATEAVRKLAQETRDMQKINPQLLTCSSSLLPDAAFSTACSTQQSTCLLAVLDILVYYDQKSTNSSEITGQIVCKLDGSGLPKTL